MQNKKIKFQATNLSRYYGTGNKLIKAVDNISLKVYDGEILSIVGGSACGKTVLANLLLNLEVPSSGILLFDEKPIDNQVDHWRQVQTIFQNPFSAFNQFYNVEEQLTMAFNICKVKPSKEEIDARIRKALYDVNLDADEFLKKYPFELSGGQSQRLLIARIFAIEPDVLIADEPTSMIDACSRANILDYLLKLKEKLNMTIVFITHDIGLSYFISDRIFIMHKGQIVERGNPDDVMLRPKNEQTIKLFDDIPQIHKEWIKR